ncbi:MAG: hypothetical protein WEF99_15570 [Thermoanaerobaculia bacterium]
MDRRHNLAVLGGALHRRIKDNEGKPVQRLASVLLSTAGILANRVGMHRLGARLYAAGMFPRGTVGRREG